ncbi:hypothetical protein BDV93DRAFT_522102 [Ceratobasidium sp. AG-I]|nr:hypothetical protein BDV93DRAFT_522102 [Ceratobasidium sp. AG-I]
MHNPTSAQRVMETPELISLICDFAGKNDRIMLLHVSRHVFACVVTSLWRDISDVKVLFKLLPGVTITKVGGNEATIINFPAILDTTRFNIYASFIKHLEIVSSSENNTSLRFGKNAQSFLTFAQTVTLAPKLAKLAVVISEYNPEEHVHWVENFLSSSLLNIELVYYNRASSLIGLDSASVLGLLEKISSTCPNLQELAVFPSGDVTHGSFEGSATPNPGQLEQLDSLRAQMASFRNLRTFKSSVFILRPGILSALGELPHLETLSINGDCREPHIVGLVVPYASFPSLRTLELCRMNWPNLRYLSDFTPLLHRLTKVVMVHAFVNGLRYYDWDEEITDNVEGDWTMDLVSNMAKNAPLLDDLMVDYGGWDSTAILTPEWLPALRDLRVKRLSLQNVEFECSLSEFASMQPNLEEFRASKLSFGAILQVARCFPCLRLLELDSIYLECFWEEEEVSDDQGNDPKEGGDGARSSGDRYNGHDSSLEPLISCTSAGRMKVGCLQEKLQLKATYRVRSGAPIAVQKIEEIARFFHRCQRSLECVDADDEWNSAQVRKTSKEMAGCLNRAIMALDV